MEASPRRAQIRSIHAQTKSHRERHFRRKRQLHPARRCKQEEWRFKIRLGELGASAAHVFILNPSRSVKSVARFLTRIFQRSPKELLKPRQHKSRQFLMPVLHLESQIVTCALDTQQPSLRRNETQS